MKMAQRIDLTRHLTAVIITYNRCDDLAVTLQHTLALPEKMNILVVDNASTDGTEEMVRRHFRQVRYLRMKRNLYAGARNEGAKATRTSFIAFTDDDCRWQDGALSGAVKDLLGFPGVAAVAPKVLVRGEKPDQLNRYFETSPLPAFVNMPGRPVMGFLEGSVVMRRKAFLSSGGYDHRSKINGEGRRVAIRLVEAGWGICYDPRLVCCHYPSVKRDIARRQRDGARNSILSAALAEPWENVFFETGLNLKSSLRHPAIFLGTMEALITIPFILSKRSRVSPRMENIFRLLREQKKEMGRNQSR